LFEAAELDEDVFIVRVDVTFDVDVCCKERKTKRENLKNVAL
jgi:hypothetical protein